MHHEPRTDLLHERTHRPSALPWMPSGVSQGKTQNEKENGWPGKLCIIPQSPATETIFKDTLISAGLTACEKWPGPRARQTLQGERLHSMSTPFTDAHMMDEMGTALGWLGSWFKEP